MTSRPLPIGSPSEHWRLPRHPRSVGRARQRLRQELTARRISTDMLATAQLLLSELVTNAVQHAHVPPGREIEVRYEMSDSHLRVEVADASDEQPEQRAADDDDERGRGLLLVDALATKWGVNHRHDIGKLVWFELALPPHTSCYP
ncbi:MULTISPECIES: ATP-binding protein [Streptomyces]|uniref:ATP-binding protein n=1 Tax=Streptomyces TaxID=1883 RepID=UPI000F7B7B55|nr:ATP-binding protein [Streptomyces sp. WAC05858]RSS41234.1 ATP-binding protein [Streptomyces sp. WAC05858]WTA85948.1 ATP-binding protein [Streptomyces antimycoticus]WTB03493.1 ATP-binding protein [Streptomyces antimycoticus]